MTIGDALYLKVALDGVDQVVRGLDSIGKASESAAARARVLRGVGTTLVAAGAGIVVASNAAYERFERMRRTFVAFTNEAQGNALAKWLSNYAIEANTSTETLQKAAQTWLSTTNDLQGVKPLVTGLERLGGLGKTSDELERIALALSQIKSSGTFKAQDLNQLVNAGVPLQRVANRLGVKNIRGALGMDSDKVIKAALETFNALPKQSPLGSQAGQNAIEAFQQSLIPTGKLVSNDLTPVANGAAAVAGGFGQINAVTGGATGLIVVLGLVAGGGYLIYKSFRSANGMINRFTSSGARARANVDRMADAALRAAINLERLANCRCPGGGHGGAGGGPGVVPVGGGPGGSGAPISPAPALPGRGVGVNPALPAGGAAAGGAAIGWGATLAHALGWAALFGVPAIAGGIYASMKLSKAVDPTMKDPDELLKEHLEDWNQYGASGLRYQRGDPRHPAYHRPTPIPTAMKPHRRASQERSMLNIFTNGLGGG